VLDYESRVKQNLRTIQQSMALAKPNWLKIQSDQDFENKTRLARFVNKKEHTYESYFAQNFPSH